MSDKDFDYIRIPNVPVEVKQDLQAIAKNEGTTLAALLKPVLRQVRDSYPEYMRKVDNE